MLRIPWTARRTNILEWLSFHNRLDIGCLPTARSLYFTHDGFQTDSSNLENVLVTGKMENIRSSRRSSMRWIDPISQAPGTSASVAAALYAEQDHEYWRSHWGFIHRWEELSLLNLEWGSWSLAMRDRLKKKFSKYFLSFLTYLSLNKFMPWKIATRHSISYIFVVVECISKINTVF